MKSKNSAFVLKELIRYYRIPVTKTTIDSELEKHPHCGNLYAISDVLHSWKIPNQALRITTDILPKIPLPCIAHIKTAKGEFGLIYEVGDNYILISRSNHRRQKLPVLEFTKQFNGEVLVVQIDHESGERNYDNKRREELLNNLRYPFLAFGLFTVLVLALANGTFINTIGWQTGLLALLKTTGLVVSILLLIQSININNPIIERLCGKATKECTAILSSKAANVTAFLSWSELGFFYFCGSWLLLLFNSQVSQVLAALAFFNLLCIPIPSTLFTTNGGLQGSGVVSALQYNFCFGWNFLH